MTVSSNGKAVAGLLTVVAVGLAGYTAVVSDAARERDRRQDQAIGESREDRHAIEDRVNTHLLSEGHQSSKGRIQALEERVRVLEERARAIEERLVRLVK